MTTKDLQLVFGVTTVLTVEHFVSLLGNDCTNVGNRVMSKERFAFGIHVSSMFMCTCAYNGSYWCWGWLSYGQLSINYMYGDVYNARFSNVPLEIDYLWS